MRPEEDMASAPADPGRAPVSRRWRFASRTALALLRGRSVVLRVCESRGVRYVVHLLPALG